MPCGCARGSSCVRSNGLRHRDASDPVRPPVRASSADSECDTRCCDRQTHPASVHGEGSGSHPDACSRSQSRSEWRVSALSGEHRVLTSKPATVLEFLSSVGACYCSLRFSCNKSQSICNRFSPVFLTAKTSSLSLKY